MTRRELAAKIEAILDDSWDYGDEGIYFMSYSATEDLVAFIESELGVELKEK